MTKAVKGDPKVDLVFSALVIALEEHFWDNWRNFDYDTISKCHQRINGMLPKMLEIAHTRGKQGHGKRKNT